MMPLLIAVWMILRKRLGALLSSGWQQGCAGNGFSLFGERRKSNTRSVVVPLPWEQAAEKIPSDWINQVECIRALLTAFPGGMLQFCAHSGRVIWKVGAHDRDQRYYCKCLCDDCMSQACLHRSMIDNESVTLRKGACVLTSQSDKTSGRGGSRTRVPV